MTISIFGHTNPDTDSVSSAIALSDLLNQLGLDTIPYVLGNISKESNYVLDYFKLSRPSYLPDVKVQVRDLQYDFSNGISPKNSILSTYNHMKANALETVGVVDHEDKLLGIISMKDIAMGVIEGEYYHLQTSLQNLINDLDGRVLYSNREFVDGKVSVMAYYYETDEDHLGEDDIIIVGDRYHIIEYAISCKVQLIIITGGKEIPQKYIDLAKENGVTMILVPKDTYFISKIINMSNFTSQIMRKNNIIQFTESEYLEEVKEELHHSHFRNYPVTDSQNKFLGFINRKHIMNPTKKKVILVDHNEYSQSAEGLEESEILAIVDHHKIGDISTSIPINFRNRPVGSTCTIVYWMYREYNVEIPFKIAGALLSGILSDTLLFKSPTTTDMDKKAANKLNEILNLNIDDFAMDMFKFGTSLEGQTIPEIFHKDFKEFHLDTYKTGISQVFTLDIDHVFNKKDEFMTYIQDIHKRKEYDITLVLITDILKEGSYLLYQSKHHSIISSAFDVSTEQGAFAEGIVSRKKQVIPKLLDTIQLIK
ncbi:putative manganese-dependent inorganic diphosphatase [Serpentinicella sp. ANB-PHB4]|uniref:putative manganese-dependent inorganic diphosphatase n=1 Tax=Serpentinicella sp. ANB-PHB4 TaxID=3074076 RepID=UPI00285E0DE0|nr:putative manganese-dependent inorganic diphosphatase [Serpentinicella sp. ANB-PHB4]MDR5658496.1 putative manganese-dependent inorganic diphosphatase [Serpentinicella sp. ANB-PHB4]